MTYDIGNPGPVLGHTYINLLIHVHLLATVYAFQDESGKLVDLLIISADVFLYIF